MSVAILPNFFTRISPSFTPQYVNVALVKEKITAARIIFSVKFPNPIPILKLSILTVKAKRQMENIFSNSFSCSSFLKDKIISIDKTIKITPATISGEIGKNEKMILPTKYPSNGIKK